MLDAYEQAERQQGVHQEPTDATLPSRAKLSKVALVTASLLIAFSASILGVIGLSGTTPDRPVLELPETLLPGSTTLSNEFCPGRECCARTALTPWDSVLICRVNFDGADVAINFDDFTRRIVQTTISSSGYAVGDLITAWGIPSGITQNHNLSSVYWGTRSATIIGSALQPGSRVEVITYNLAIFPALPWRGFTRRGGF